MRTLFVVWLLAVANTVTLTSLIAQETPRQADFEQQDLDQPVDQLSTGSYSGRQRATLEMWRGRNQSRDRVQQASRHPDAEVAGRAQWICASGGAVRCRGHRRRSRDCSPNPKVPPRLVRCWSKDSLPPPWSRWRSQPERWNENRSRNKSSSSCCGNFRLACMPPCKPIVCLNCWNSSTPSPRLRKLPFAESD